MEDRKNAAEITQSGDFYLLGIGGYAGTERTQTLQTVINNKLDKGIIPTKPGEYVLRLTVPEDGKPIYHWEEI